MFDGCLNDKKKTVFGYGEQTMRLWWKIIDFEYKEIIENNVTLKVCYFLKCLWSVQVRMMVLWMAISSTLVMIMLRMLNVPIIEEEKTISLDKDFRLLIPKFTLVMIMLVVMIMLGMFMLEMFDVIIIEEDKTFGLDKDFGLLIPKFCRLQCKCRKTIPTKSYDHTMEADKRIRLVRRIDTTMLVIVLKNLLTPNMFVLKLFMYLMMKMILTFVVKNNLVFFRVILNLD